MNYTHDLIVIGAGSGGLTAAAYAVQMGAKVALVESNQLGGASTWTGCIPSKALVKIASVMHHIRTADQYGIAAETPTVDMLKVRDYIRQAVNSVYQQDAPEKLSREGIEIVIGLAHFVDPHTVVAGKQTLSAKHFIIATGARPYIPEIDGLHKVPYVTYEQIFENNYLPARLTIIGGGPVGMEVAQAYQRLGSRVTIIARRLLPRDEPEAVDVLARVFAREGIEIVPGLATAARMGQADIVVNAGDHEIRTDLLLVAAGRKPNLDALDLDKAGVQFTAEGISVDPYLRTNVPHIYAAGDCLGRYQFSHIAASQAFQAARNILLPRSSPGLSAIVPWTTFTDPELAHVGLTETDARERFGPVVQVTRWDMKHTDRAIAENDMDGFIKLVHKQDGKLLGATIVSARAGETITEFTMALQRGLRLQDLAATLHVFPTYASSGNQLAATVSMHRSLTGLSGKLRRAVSGVFQ